MAILLLSGLIVATSTAGGAIAQTSPALGTTSAEPHAAFVAEASRRFGIPELWIVAVKRAESAGDVRAISSAGAMGLMQIMPGTWAGLRTRYGLGHDPYDPRDNILAGAAYLREMFDRYGDVPAMLGAYNAGPARYDAYLRTGRALPAETRAYIAFLAPQLSGASPSGSPSNTPPPTPDWREAPLFVVRSIDARSVVSRPGNAHTDDRRPPVTARASDPAETLDTPLVVARSDPETP
ncbi:MULTISPECIES: lytic transglycosylase domain-containing protein [Sphingomonas]|uniref:Membrane-bound lytic murein transglycosylase B n=1 Tax=Sphingomonas pseudosanguinis TaxID=413712 RepID=A0A7W6F3W5_9SPHN|nr:MULTISPECIES: lytic transglycosylase domain-containing protein [Sphingomonas]MBB3880243.1 membrane-bound lytic murein transglycosylase B [Sphingomonas pseudosanguinis]